VFDCGLEHLGHPFGFVIRGHDDREVHCGQVIDVRKGYRFVGRRAASVFFLRRIGNDRLGGPKDESCIQLEFQ